MKSNIYELELENEEKNLIAKKEKLQNMMENVNLIYKHNSRFLGVYNKEVDMLNRN